VVNFLIELSDSEGNNWNSQFYIVLKAPELYTRFITVNDKSVPPIFLSNPDTLLDYNADFNYTIQILSGLSNDNQRFDAGESAQVSFDIINAGNADATNMSISLNSESSFVTVTNKDIIIDKLASKQDTTVVFNVSISNNTPKNQIIDLALHTTSGKYVVNWNTNFTTNQLIESFENTDTSKLKWINDEVLPWVSDTFNSYSGQYSYRSAPVDDEQTTAISITLNVVKNDSISFFVKTSCEEDVDNNYDFLGFYINGILTARWDGIADWRRAAFYVPAGTHTFEWKYSKDQSLSEGEDAVWLDFITFPESDINLNIKNADLKADILPSWLTFTNNNDGTALISGKAPNQVFIDKVKLTASQNGFSAIQEFWIYIGENAENEKLRIWPIPSNGIINIMLQPEFSNTPIKIYDLFGKIITETSLESEVNTLNLSTLKSGVYFIKFEGNGISELKKIIIN